MEKRRQSDVDESQNFKRSESRTFNRDNYWYFSSREGDMGPYDTEAEAIEAAFRVYTQLGMQTEFS